MFRTAPGHMNSLKDQDLRLSYSNLFSINKASNIRTVESGNSIAFGASYLSQDTQKSENKFEANIGQIFNLDTTFKVFKNFDEYPITQVARADKTLNIPAVYVLLDPDYCVIHHGKTTELRNNTRTHLYSLSESRLKGKILAKKRDINARTLSPHPASYKIRFLRESDFSLETVEKFTLICFKPGKQS